MNFQFAKTGSSFKGAMAYYTHDKRARDQEAHPVTSERVMWAETRNMLTDRTDTATRIMISTAERAPELKAAAGIKNTGRKATQPVAAFSLAWHPDEAKSLDRAEMARAADQALRVLKLEHCQAVIIAHSDRAHPHVHVVINRVNPENGRMEKIDPNRVRALDKWAYEYERDRGKIYSPDRAKKFERPKDRRRGARERPEGRVERDTALDRGKRPESAVQSLRERSAALKGRHKEEWRELGRAFAQTKRTIYNEARAAIREAYSDHRTDSKPIWREHFQEQRKQARERTQMSRSFVGRLSLSVVAAREDIRMSEPGTRPGMARLVLAYLISGEYRERMFKEVAERDTVALGERLREDGERKVEPLREDRARRLEAARETYTRDRQALSERQRGERAEIREAWERVYRENGRTWRPQAGRGPTPFRQSEARPVQEQDRKPSKFAWLDERSNKASSPRSKFERSAEARDKSRGKDRDDEERER